MDNFGAPDKSQPLSALKEEEESDDDDEAAPILANSVKTMQKEKTSFSSKTGYDAFLSSRVGDFGRWQMCVFLVVSPVIMANAFINVGQTFLFYEQAFRCEVSPCDDPSLASSSPVYDSYFAPYAIPFWEDRDDLDDEDDITAKSCTFFRYNGSDALEEGGICKEEDFAKSLEDTVICSSHVYDESEYENSLVSATDLGTCGDYDDWPLYPVITRASLLSTGTAIGMFFGAFPLGLLSDKFGRKDVMIANVFLAFAFLLGSAFCQNYWGAFAFRVFLGFVSKGLFNLGSTLLVEIAGTTYRMYLGILANVPFAVGEICVGLIAYLVQDWDYFLLTLSLLTLPCVAIWFFIPESPRWLISRGKIEEAKKVLGEGAAKNKRPPLPVDLSEKDLLSEDGRPKQQLGASFLFADLTVSMITLVLWVDWIVISMAYYGLAFTSVSLSSDIYVSFVLTALIEIPSYIAAVLVLNSLGRRTVTIFSQILAGVCCVAAAFVEDSWLVTTLTLAGKFGASAAFATIYLHTAEVYPTSLRSTAVGSASTMGRVGTIAAPILAGIKPVALPLSIMGVAGMIGGALAILLPEPLGQPLPETLEDVKTLYKNPKPWYKWMTKRELSEMELRVLTAKQLT